MGSPTSFWREHAPKNALNLKIRASLADQATVSVSPKILQLDLGIEMFSAKYSLRGPIKWSTGEVRSNLGWQSQDGRIRCPCSFLDNV